MVHNSHTTYTLGIINGVGRVTSISDITMSAQEKAEQYVRSKCPELAEAYKDALYVYVRNGAGKDSYSDVCDYVDEYPQWIPLELQHWLRVLGSVKDMARQISSDASLMCYSLWNTEKVWRLEFNLTTGQPATEADYQAFNDIVGI